MGRKVQKKKYKMKAENQYKHRNEINGILLLASGILMLLSFCPGDLTGLFGNFIKNTSLGLLGLPSLLIPPIILAYAAYIIKKREEKVLMNRVVYTALLFLLVSALIQTGHYKPEDFYNLKPAASIEKFYIDGTELVGGGVFGGLISLPFLLTFRTVGTIIILTALSMVDIILITNASIANFINNLRLLFVKENAIKEKDTKNKKSKGTYEIDDGPEVIGDNDNLSLQFTPKQKVIDFKLEKDSRETEKKSSARKSSKPDAVAASNEEDEDEPLNLVINDLKNKGNNPEIADIKINTGEGRTSAKKAVPALIIPQTAENSIQYRYPVFELLKDEPDIGGNSKTSRNQVLEGAKKLEETLASFGVSAKVINVTRGPTVTRYELQPSAGVKVSRIVNLADDIALNLAASGVRLEAPIPGKAAIGIEVPNKEVNMVLAREVLESQEFSHHPSKLAFAIGKDISGECVVADIAKMPHLLIAGATGSGKSVCINSLIVSLLYKASPEEVKLLMIDPKVVELGIYNGIPHLLIPVVTEPKKAAGALNWAVQEMVNRYKLFADKAVRDLKGFNELMKKTGEQPPLPQIVIIIDELADLMMVAPNDVEDAICRLAQMARAAGMHLVIATQRPSVDVITGVIKANIPSRISFAVSSQIDSRTILDMAGAEKLLGRGDMLFHPVGKPKPLRLQGANITDAEVEKVVDFIKAQCNAVYDDDIIEEINSEDGGFENPDEVNDELLPRAIELVVDSGQASVSLIQRKFRVGYARAARIVDQMEARGIIGGYEGSKPRQILMSKQQWQEMQMANKE